MKDKLITYYIRYINTGVCVKVAFMEAVKQVRMERKIVKA
jgi:hypothetical protein